MKRRVRLDAVLAAPGLSQLPPQIKRALGGSLRKLAEDPTGRTVGLDVKALEADGDTPQLYRLRVGQWRAVFAIRGREVIVTRIFHRRDGYGWLERLDPSPNDHDREP